ILIYFRWVYSDSSVTKSTVKYGQFGSYKGGGYYWDFPVDKKRTVELIRKLKNNKWIDWATRAIMIDFVVYNVNLNLFAICKVRLSLVQQVFIFLYSIQYLLTNF
ncbi:unnamed protein product, partial [Brassicogethes aeneus]